MGEVVGAVGERGEAPHRERERLVLLDQVEEALAARGPRGGVRDVRRPPGRGDPRVRRARRQRVRLAREGQLDAVEHAREAVVALQLVAPARGQRPGRVDRDHADPRAALGEPPREVELPDVAPEEVLEVDRRDEQVDPRRRVGAHVEPQRRDLVVERAHDRRALRAAPRASGRAARAARRRAGPASAARRARSRRSGAASRRRGGAATRRRASPCAGRAARARRAPPAARAAARERSARSKRSSARRALRPQPVAAAELEHRRELHQPAGVAEVVHAPHPGALARVAEQVRDPLDHAGHAVRALVARRTPRRAARSRRAAGRRRRSGPWRARRPPASGRGSARTGRRGTAARRRAAPAGTATRRRSPSW